MAAVENVARDSVEVPRGEIAFARTGDGPPALFVHGFLLNHTFWSALTDEVADLRTCIAVDLPAHGGSRVAADASMALEAQADTLAAVCDGLGLGPVDLVGNDTGGAIAQLLAARHPERVRSLTLTNCDVHTNCPPGEFVETAQAIRSVGVGTVLQQLRDNPALARSEQGFGVGWQDPSGLSDDVVRGFVQPILDAPGGVSGVERWLDEFNGEALVEHEPALRELDVPALIVWGTDDPLFPVTWARWLHDALPSARDVVEVDGGKLYFPQERPKELAAPLRDFWRGQ